MPADVWEELEQAMVELEAAMAENDAEDEDTRDAERPTTLTLIRGGEADDDA
jgi:hypothetical protein